MLVEEGQIPKGSSVDWGRKLTEKLQKNELFFTNPKFRQLRFGIWHYADGSVPFLFIFILLFLLFSQFVLIRR